jgi:4-diphosphocytidyl-2-C-methyl-D-erythritol kinase
VETILQAVSLYDVVHISIERGTDITVGCDDPAVPSGAANLAARAADLFLQQPGLPRVAVTVWIAKRIPLEAGLGGGSSNAAATLLGLRYLMAPDMPLGLLESLAAGLGSDVPFFLRGGTQVGWGRGDVLAPVSTPLVDTPFVLAKSEARCGTREVYARYDRGVGEERALPLAAALPALAERRFDQFVANDLRDAAIAVAPDVADTLRDLGEHLGPVEVSGSGAACFAVAPSMTVAETVAGDLRARLPFAQACTAIAHGCKVVEGDGE